MCIFLILVSPSGSRRTLFFSRRVLNNSEVMVFKRACWSFNNLFRGSAILLETIQSFPTNISYVPYFLIIILFGYLNIINIYLISVTNSKTSQVRYSSYYRIIK